MPSLVVYSPDGTRRATVQMTNRPIKVGRADNCDVVLRDDAEVSREHAEISLDEQGRVVVTDKGSKNGTRVDEGVVFRDTRRVASHSLRIGEHLIQVLGAPPPSAPEPPVLFAPDEHTPSSDTQFFPSSRGLDLNQQRLSLLIQLSERIGGVFERKQLLEQALDACCEALGFERGLIALKTQRGDTELPVTRNVERDETGAFKVSRTLINRALVEGERAIVNNPATDLAGGNLSDSLVRFPICSALCVPILYRNEILGVLYGDRITQASTYQPADVDFLAAIAQQVGNGLANLRLFQEHVRSQRVYAELEQARLIQRQLLPSAPLQIGQVAIEGYNQASSAVSGDYFDYFDLEDGRVGFIIADVTGHGLPAALIMANLQSAIRVALSADVAVPELAARVNKLIFRNTASHVFITAVLGTIDSRSGLVEYVGAGHPCPVLLGGQGVSTAEDQNSLPLGVNPDETYHVASIAPTDQIPAILFYTDGLVEATGRDGRILGLQPITDALAKLTAYQPATIIRTAREVVRRHLGGLANMDDMTLLAARIR